MNAAASAPRRILPALVLSLLVILLSQPLAAQLQAPQAGVVELGLLLRHMDGERRVLMIGAHPDDEDTSLLATMALGRGARTAYLSLSRGEGGQNLIGPELEEGLGIIRTGELLSARSLDGAEQYFTRAFDFGYSRSAEETFGHWPREELVRDVVEVVRSFRPHVIVSIFTGTDRDGHGQHQAAGIVAREAFEAASDPTRFPDQLEGGLEPWAPIKYYQSTRFRPDATTLEVRTGRLDPLLGRSHFQVAMASRSRHRSQDMGTAETPGPRSAGLELVESRAVAGSVPGDPGHDAPDPRSDRDLFTGIDTTLVGLARAASLPEQARLLDAIETYRSGIGQATRGLGIMDPGSGLPDLRAAADGLRRAIDLVRDAERISSSPPARELARVLDARGRLLSDALLLAGGVIVEARADRARATPGESVDVELLIWNAGAVELSLDAVALDVPAGWTAERIPDAGSDAGRDRVPADAMVRQRFRVGVPADAEPSRLYYLTEERDGSLYRWPDDPDLRGRPGNPPLISARVALTLHDGVEGVEGPMATVATVTRPASFVEVDKALGEFRVPFMVVPALSVSVDPARIAWPTERDGSRPVTVRVAHQGGPSLEGQVRLEVPAGWTVDPETRPFLLGPTDSETSSAEGAFTFQVRPPGDAPAGTDTSVRFRAVAHVVDGLHEGGGGGLREGDGSGDLREGGGSGVIRDVDAEESAIHETGVREGLTLIDYPHIDPVPFYESADVHVTRLPVRVADGIRVGYLMGPGDDGIRALRDLGVTVDPLDAEAFRASDLAVYDAVVLGVRAYETRTDLIAGNDRLLEYARDGGTVIVQYNKYEYPDGGFAPFPVEMRRPHDRVTDPSAPVTLLEPEHPLLTSPNRITAGDFEGWIQERGLYFLSGWDERYTPLLEMSDPGLEPNRGSLVVARVGSGAYVYTGLALFRQLPAGVPGAFRLLANLVSLSGADLEPIATTDGDPASGTEESERW